MVAGNNGRQDLIDAAIVSIARSGAARTHPKDLTEQLGLSKSLVNFHFDGREGLLVEAIATALERLVDALHLVVTSSGVDPHDRLMGWTDEYLGWTAANPGLAAAAAHPGFVIGTSDHIAPGMARIDAATLATRHQLGTLVDDVRGRSGRATAAGDADRFGHDGPTTAIWWLLQGAGAALAADPARLEEIRSTARAWVSSLSV